MGYVRKDRLAHVKILDGDYAGLELDLSLSISMGDFINFQRRRFGDDSSLASQAEAMAWFGDKVLLGWNHLEADGETATPADTEGFLSLDPAMVLTIINRWREALTEVDLPLGKPSQNGASSEVASTTRPASPLISRRKSPRRR